MIKKFMVILLTFTTGFPLFAQQSRAVNDVTIVALLITSGPETPVLASVTHTLASLEAQTLKAIAPNISELRSILKRFAAAAIDTDIALVYFDGAVLEIDNRAFVAPGGIELHRPSDLLTRAIPILALARATALAAHGGAVLVHASGQDQALIDGVTLATKAPSPRTGTSPILFATANAAEALAQGVARITETNGDIDLNQALGQLAALNGVTISQLPSHAATLRHTAAPEIAQTPQTTAAPAQGITLPQIGMAPQASSIPAVVAADATPPQPAPAGESTTAAPVTPPATEPTQPEVALSLDVLRAMQSGLTRAQKRRLQLKLRGLHFYNGLIDGIFGHQSARAISAYQQSIGAEITGVLTPAQLQSLSE